MAANLSLALGICNDLCSLVSVETVASLVINRQQCMLLSQKLLETQETLQAVQHKLSDDDEMTWSDSPYTGAVLLELIYVLQKAKKIVLRDCFCSGQWMKATLRQGGDWKETFGESLYDLHWLCSILLKQMGQDSQVLERADCDRMLWGTDVNTLLIAAKKDHEDLKGLLRGNHTCSGQCCDGECRSMQCLATQLLTKLEFQAEMQAWPVTEKKNYHEWLYKGNLDNLSKWPLVLSVNKQDLKRGSLLDAGSFGIVHEAEWLGEPYAMKISKYGYQEILKQEIAVLSGLHHPHIMHLVCCAEEGGECLYVMECMNKSLSRMLENSKLSLIRSVDIMLQIAEGMNHLHSMGLVHRDLKPDNILIKCDEAGSENSMSALGAEPLWIAKVSDFGCTKVKMESTAYAHQTIPIGSLMFMAPEMYELAHGNEPPERFHPKKTDVYSFGLVCFAVLIGEPTPFPPKEVTNPSVKAFQDGVRKGKRPQLPADSPNHLSSLIQQCWDGNPVKRPNFHNICRELRYIKGLLLTAFQNIGHGDASYVKDAKQTCIEGLPQLASCSTDATDAKSNETTAMSLLHLAKETSSRRLQIPRLGSVLDLVPRLGSDKPPLVVMTLNQLRDIVTTSHWQHWQHKVLEANAIPELTRLLQSNNITIAKTAGLLLDPESTKCQRDAVVALEALAFTHENPVLVTVSLQVDEVLTFIGAQRDPDCRRAAVGLLSLMAKDNPQLALRSVELIADLLQCQDATAARRAADVLLNFAGANLQVRLQIAKVNVLEALLNLQPSNMEYREKLISTLILFCQSGGDEYSQSTMQKAVIDASGHEILLQCLEEETLKPLAAKGLAELLKTKENQPALMKAGFVNFALNQIVFSRFYDVNVALALRTLSESSEGRTCMKNDPHSSQALILLLEHCPDPEGKKAAAKVIDRLFSELEDRTEIIANCGLLINLVGEQYKEVLEALEVVTRESSGKLSAYKQKVLDFLVPVLQSNSDISIQDLVLLILANLSCDIIRDSTDTEKQSIRWAIVNSDIPGILYEITNTLSSKGLRNTIVIIRNISLAGSDACKKLLEDDGAAHFLITKLLRVHLQQEMELTDVITYSVIALEKFAEDDHGKTVIVTNKGVDVLVDTLQRIPVKSARAKVYATKILVMLADDESLQKAVCKALFEAKPLTGLMDILKSAYEDACKGRAATLIKYLVMHGPPHALTSIVQAGCIEVLYENLPVAKDALDYICLKSREADNRRRKLQRSQSSGLKLSHPEASQCKGCFWVVPMKSHPK